MSERQGYVGLMYRAIPENRGRGVGPDDWTPISETEYFRIESKNRGGREAAARKLRLLQHEAGFNEPFGYGGSCEILWHDGSTTEEIFARCAAILKEHFPEYSEEESAP